MRSTVATTFFLLVLTACERIRPDEQAPVPQVTLYGVRLWYYQTGRLVTEGYATRATYERSQNAVGASQVRLCFPSRDPHTSPGAEVHAGQLEGNLQSRQAVGTDGVVVRAGERNVAWTERATFDGQALEAQGSYPTTLKVSGLQVQAGGFHLWLRDERLELDGQVQSRLGEPHD